MTKQFKEATKNIPWYTKIQGKGRYTGVKDKAWAIISDFVRIRDFITYRSCVSCAGPIEDWKLGQAGHFISMGGHGAAIGFCLENIHLQCPTCNIGGSFHLGSSFEREIERRGIEIATLNLVAQQSVKADDWYFLGVLTEVYKKFQEFRLAHPDFDYPDYLSY